MELNLWNNNQLLMEWLNKHSKNILKCDFDFDVANPSSNALIDTISEKMGIKRECIAVSAGISELISSILFSSLWMHVYIFEPEFGLYRRCIQNSMYKNNTTIISLHSVHTINKAVEQYKTENEDLLCVSSPNWFSGERLNYNEIIDLLDSFHGTVVIDESYVDYANIPDELTRLAETHDRLILLRSFSKGWFVSGLRIGYMVSKAYAEYFRNEIIVPHSVSTPSMRIIQDLLKDKKLMGCFQATRNDVIKTREYLKGELMNLEGCRCFQSESNFLTILLDKKFEDKKGDLSELFGVKIMDVQMYDELSIKYWISNMDNAAKMVEFMKKIVQ